MQLPLEINVNKASPKLILLQRGIQQDAQEFLTQLLDQLAEECVSTVGATTGTISSHASASNDGAANEWQTVEKNGKPAVMRSSGLPQLPNPVSKIFAGISRIEIRSKGTRNQDQTFTSLHLPIDDQEVRSILDALIKFNATSNADPSTPDKHHRSFLHKLPPVLVLHIGRFTSQGVSKNGRHVDYPLELEIPSAVLSQPARIEYAESRKYRLVSVVYHHGLFMTSGHYTVDVRRQDEQSWLRINDHSITAIDGSDVVGSDKNVSVQPGTAPKGTSSEGVSSNRFAAMGENNEGGAWQSVGASGSGGKKSSNAGNGKASGTSTPKGTPAKDNKVAYLLFYQKLE